MDAPKDKVLEFIRKYREVFNISESIVLCGREKCKELIAICKELDGNTDYGNLDTGMMNVDNIYNLRKQVQDEQIRFD